MGVDGTREGKGEKRERGKVRDTVRGGR